VRNARCPADPAALFPLGTLTPGAPPSPAGSAKLPAGSRGSVPLRIHSNRPIHQCNTEAFHGLARLPLQLNVST
jgi:hypothetical protein